MRAALVAVALAGAALAAAAASSGPRHLPSPAPRGDGGPGTSAAEVRVGSKAFTESIVLGELAAQLARSAGAAAVHRRALGGTRVLWEAL